MDADTKKTRNLSEKRNETDHTHPLHCATRSAHQRGTKTFISATSKRQQENPIRLTVVAPRLCHVAFCKIDRRNQFSSMSHV